jgi:hypothetical protein
LEAAARVAETSEQKAAEHPRALRRMDGESAEQELMKVVAAAPAASRTL